MRFSIVTASFRQAAWLRRAVRSIEDQAVECEHIIQDAGTGPELERWVRDHSRSKLFVERDSGMYDALNRGFARASGDIFAFLNCDEQYLRGALAKVRACFQANPGSDVVVGDYLIVNAAGELLSFHKATPLRRAMVITDHLYDYTCALFFRRHVWEAAGGFDTRYKAVGDAEWVCRMLLQKPRIAYLGDYTSAFAITGGNLSLDDRSAEETAALRATAPAWMRAAARPLRAMRHVEKLLRGGYRSRPIHYALYADELAAERTLFSAEQPSHRHPWSRR